MADLQDIPGLGPAKIDKLAAAGIHDLQDLAELDLRRRKDIPIGNDVLKRAKAQARRLLAAQGADFEKAPYKERPAAPAKRTRGTAPRTDGGPTAAVASGDKPAKKGFWARLRRR